MRCDCENGHCEDRGIHRAGSCTELAQAALTIYGLRAHLCTACLTMMLNHSNAKDITRLVPEAEAYCLEYRVWTLHSETCSHCANGGAPHLCALRKGERDLVAAHTYFQHALDLVGEFNDKGLTVFLELPRSSSSETRMYVGRKEVEA